jgi:hypothetical protein
MEQRRLRLGDILDDYCPRERRLTNHAVVAMIEEDVKQTRCTTCDAEHAYKGGKVPKRRKKETPAALYKEVLSTQNAETPHIVVDPESEHHDDEVHASDGDGTSMAVDETTEVESELPLEEPVAIAATQEDDPVVPEVEEGPVHRPLIRAQLPRIEGQKEERRLPEFTIRQRGGNGHFRGGDHRMKSNRHGGGNGQQAGNANGNRAQGGSRFAGPRQPGSGRPGQPGRGGGQPGFRSGQRPGGGRKRSR